MSQLQLIVTSLWIQAIRRKGQPESKRQVEDLVATGAAAWCDPVRLELWQGVTSLYDRQTLRDMEEELTKLPVNAETWTISCRLADTCRKKGFRFPMADLLIFACAKQHDVPLISRDAHFLELETHWQTSSKLDNTN